MDGMAAIEGGLRSPAGEIYNDLPDRISDALVLLAAGYSLSWPACARELGWTATLLAVISAYVRATRSASSSSSCLRENLRASHRRSTATRQG